MHTLKLDFLPNEKIEDVMKPFETRELLTRAKFLQVLKKLKALDQLLSLKT